MDKIHITNSSIDNNLFTDYTFRRYAKGRFSCSINYKELWKVKLGEAFVKSSSGEKYEIKSGDSVTFSPQKAISIYVPDSLEVFKTYLDADHKQEIKENQQINYHILDIIFISLGIYKECQDGLLTQGYKIEEIVCYGKKGNISQAINDEKRLDEVFCY